MEFKSVSVNNCYILRDVIFDNQFFTYINAKAIYSASVFHLGFFKGDISIIKNEQIKEYQKYTNDLYKLNSPNLYIPFEVNFHENVLYQAYYESDHFPLSVWIEEKYLIPYNIFIRIIEDIIQGLLALETAGHSHLFLTPEEILIPLQWNNTTHVKLYNVGLNSIIHTLLTEHQIKEYRNIFLRSNSKPVEKRLIKNIDDDIYSFGKIINSILPLCDFKEEKDKIFIKKILTQFLNNPKTFTSVTEIALLFEPIFQENSSKYTLPSKPLNYSYTSQASFNIPEFNEWHEEAELEPYPEHNIVSKTSNTNSYSGNKESQQPPSHSLAGGGFSFNKSSEKSTEKSFSSFLYRLFHFKKRKNTVSKTLNDFSNHLTDKIIHYNTFRTDIVNNSIYSKATNSLISKNDNRNAITKRTRDVLLKIANHNIRENRSNLKNIPIEYSKAHSKESVAPNNYKTNSLTVSGNNTGVNRKNIYEDFSKSLKNRDYGISYKIIEHIVLDKNFSNNRIIIDLEKILDDKLNQIEAHFTKDKNSTIISKLLRLDSIQPMKQTEKNKELVSQLNIKQERDVESFPLSAKNSDKRTNIFFKILYFLKKTFNKLIHIKKSPQ